MSEIQQAEVDPLSALAQEIVDLLGDMAAGHEIAFGELTVSVAAPKIGAALTKLRDDAKLRFVQLIDLTAVDHPDRFKRFDVVYHLLSPTRNLRLRLRVPAEEDQVLPSVTGVFPVANWYEREVFDMYGIMFADHPDMRRILTDYGFQGYPLRKDFPLTGHVEVRYDIEQKRVVYEPVKLPQDFRTFDFMSPWEGAHYILPGDEKARDVKP